MAKSPKIKIKPLEIKIYNDGECFICKNSCNLGSYAHFECCIAYADHKESVLKKAWKEIEDETNN